MLAAEISLMRQIAVCLLTIFLICPALVQAKPAPKPKPSNFSGRFAGEFLGGYMIVTAVQSGSIVRYRYRLIKVKHPVSGSGTGQVKGDTITNGKFTAKLKGNSLYFQPPIGDPVKLKRIK